MRYIICVVMCIFALPVYGAAEELEQIEGPEAEALARMVVTAIQSFSGLTLEVRKVRETDIFEPVVTEATIHWQKPMRFHIIEHNPETGTPDAIAVLTPERYSHYIYEFNKVEIIDIKGNENVEKGFDRYIQIMNGGYDELAKQYTFLVYRLKGAPAVPPAAPAAPVVSAVSAVTGGCPPAAADAAPADPLEAWRAACAAFTAAYGRSPAEYRIKFKPETEKLKEQLIHISFVVSLETVLARITIARTDGDIIDTTVRKLSDVNRVFEESVFTFTPPEGAEVEFLLKDR